jgi:hypothetical protein
MLGLKSLAESPISTRGIPREARAEFLCTATFTVVESNRLKYAYPVDMLATANLDIDANTLKNNSIDIQGRALFNAFPTTAVLFQANIKGKAVLTANGRLIGEGWTRVVPDSEEWTNTTNW